MYVLDGRGTCSLISCHPLLHEHIYTGLFRVSYDGYYNRDLSQEIDLL